MRTLTNALGAIVPALVLALAPCNPAATVVVGQPPGGGGGPTYLLEENFEGTGAPSGWTDNSGTPDYDDSTTSPGPLQGGESLFLASGEDAWSVTFTGQSSIEVHFRFSLGAPSGHEEIFKMLDSGGSGRLRIEYRSGGGLRVEHGSTNGTTGTAVSTATLYYGWVDYSIATGMGSNGTANLYYSTSPTKPGSPESTLTTGTATDDITQLSFIGPTNGVLFDRSLADDDTIGSNP